MALFMLPLLKVNKSKGRILALIGILLIAVAFGTLGFSTEILNVLISAFIFSLGESIMTPFYLDTLFSDIPEEAKGFILGALAGIRKIINLGTPMIASFLAGISPSLPYITSSFITMVIAIFSRNTAD